MKTLVVRAVHILDNFGSNLCQIVSCCDLKFFCFVSSEDGYALLYMLQFIFMCQMTTLKLSIAVHMFFVATYVLCVVFSVFIIYVYCDE